MTHEKRMKCPMNYPVMCANPNYYYKDYCCEKDEADCNEKGGVRSCNNPGSCMSPSGENDRFQLKINKFTSNSAISGDVPSSNLNFLNMPILASHRG